MTDGVSTITFAWFCLGGASGALHVALLWRAAARPTVWTPLLALLRMGVVAATLTAAAWCGAILAAAGGWAVVLSALTVLQLCCRTVGRSVALHNEALDD